MALQKSSAIPKDAVTFQDEGEAASYIWGIVYEWKSLSQSWALRYGPAILGGVNAMCGLVIHKHFRTRFKLGNYGYMSSAIPICAMPGVLTTLFHNYIISTDMLLMKSSQCQICYEVKSAAIQTGLGLVYPMLLAPISTLLLANRYGTYRVPDLYEGPKVMFKFVRVHTRPFSGSLVYIATIQLMASSIITYFEMKNSYSLTKELLEIEKKVLAEQHLMEVKAKTQ